MKGLLPPSKIFCFGQGCEHFPELDADVETFVRERRAPSLAIPREACMVCGNREGSFVTFFALAAVPGPHEGHSDGLAIRSTGGGLLCGKCLPGDDADATVIEIVGPHLDRLGFEKENIKNGTSCFYACVSTNRRATFHENVISFDQRRKRRQLDESR